MKNDRFFVLGILALLLTFGSILAGCDTGTGGGGNNNDTTPPTLLNAVIENAAPSQLVLTFDEATAADSPAGWSLTGATISGNPSGLGTTTWTVPLTANVSNGQTLSISYNASTGSTRDSAGNALGNIFSHTVTNNVSGGGNNFVPVTDITNGPQIALAGVELELGGVVVPSNATNQTITWSGADVINGVFTATTTGDHTVTATIANGLSESSPYTKNFTIAVYDGGAVAITLVQGDWTKPSTTGFGSDTTDTMTVTGSAFVMKNDSIGDMVYAAGIIIGLSGTNYLVQLNATLGEDGQLYPDFFYEEGTYSFTNGNTKITITTDASYNGFSPARGTWTKSP
jgi:hypothetical protein